MKNDDFFIGWAKDMPRADRRVFLGAGLALMAGTGALAAATALAQRPPPPGQWDQAAIREFSGIATSEPYALLRTRDLGGGVRTALLACMGKCGVAARIGSYDGRPVKIRGSLIERGRHAMIAVVDDMDWIASAPQLSPDPELNFPAPEPLGEVELVGEILDAKCWFGAMRPGEGKTHKACAALCIEGGIPPAFFARDAAGRAALMILSENAGPCGPDLLPYVADPVRLRARAYARGDLQYLDVNPTEFVRI